jgi:Protein of unknown function (DUF2281)
MEEVKLLTRVMIVAVCLTISKDQELLTPKSNVRRAGILKGSVKYMAPDFDAPLDDFKEYME